MDETISEDKNITSVNNQEVVDELIKDFEINSLSDATYNCDRTSISETPESPEAEESDEHFKDCEDDDDFIDENALKDEEMTLTEEEKTKRGEEAEKCKNRGNEIFSNGDFRESAKLYTNALRICPLSYSKQRSILYSNRAAAKMKLTLNESAIEDCTKAIELDENYLKAWFRRAQLYEKTTKLDEALDDYKRILQIDPLHSPANIATKRLPQEINERNEKLKTEMMDKLKDLGNMILRPFGLSTENFQLDKDPNSGGYSVKFQQNH